MDLTDQVPVDGEPTEKGAGEGDEGELQSGDGAEVAGGGANTGDDSAET